MTREIALTIVLSCCLAAVYVYFAPPAVWRAIVKTFWNVLFYLLCAVAPIYLAAVYTIVFAVVLVATVAVWIVSAVIQAFRPGIPVTGRRK